MLKMAFRTPMLLNTAATKKFIHYPPCAVPSASSDWIAFSVSP